MDFLGGDGLTQLSGLLNESREALSAKEQETVKPVALGNTKVIVGGSKDSNGSKKAIEDPKLIWRDDEIPLEDAIICRSDGRPTPRYEFAYKQSVGTEDTFLGLTGKSAGSADCNFLVIKIHFPGETMRSIQLDVTANRIKADSRLFSLFTYLPVTVIADKGSAKFDSEKHVLAVTLPIKDEYES